jgi:hypothetical protein
VNACSPKTALNAFTGWPGSGCLSNLLFLLPYYPLPAGIDLSPILAFIVLDLFTNTAAALPCEVDERGKPVATKKNAWQRRMEGSAERRRLRQQQQQSQQ